MAKRIWQLVIFLVAMGLCLFLSAGRFDWSNAWILIGIYVAALSVIGPLLYRTDPELIAERASGRAGMKTWDKYLSVAVGLLGPLAIWILAGLDERHGWSGEVAVAVTVAGIIAAVLGYSMVAWAMLSNRFFSSVVRIQTERGHTVATQGPYRFVRHPGYVGVIVLSFATALILNSWWALIPAALTTVVTVIRTMLEDKTLQRELDGYSDYAAKVRYRLAPHVW